MLNLGMEVEWTRKALREMDNPPDSDCRLRLSCSVQRFSKVFHVDFELLVLMILHAQQANLPM